MKELTSGVVSQQCAIVQSWSRFGITPDVCNQKKKSREFSLVFVETECGKCLICFSIKEVADYSEQLGK